jgi:tRNA threonylcarbamoyladenosine biosynthesis protein TsaB
MLILALETSTEHGSCALWQDGAVRERACPAGRPHSETLLPLVRELIDEAGAGFGQIDGIAFGAGPGAFTGLRIACGIAQGLAVAAGKPVVPVCGLGALAAGSQAPRVVALLDARMNEVYGATYVADGAGGYRLEGRIAVAPPEAIPLPSGGGWVAVGNGPAAYAGLAGRLSGAGIPLAAPVWPTAALVAGVAALALAGGGGIDPALAAPLYVRDKVAKTVAERLAEGGRA